MNRRKIIYRILQSLSFKINNFIDSVYAHITFYLNDVKYETFPRVKGFLNIKNDGIINLGKSVTFNSSFNSNPIGLNKRCSIYVGPGGILTVADNSGFSGVSIFCLSKITIGKFLFCGGNVNIWDTDFHPINSIDRINDNLEMIPKSAVKIGDYVFIGANSTILKGVTIGDGAVIGAGSIVTKSIPSYEIWAGNPAKFIKKAL